MTTERERTLVRDVVSSLAGLRPIGRPKPIPAHARPTGAANVDRLVSAAREMLELTGYGAFAGMAATRIRAEVSEAKARYALERLHALTAPPYR